MDGKAMIVCMGRRIADQVKNALAVFTESGGQGSLTYDTRRHRRDGWRNMAGAVISRLVDRKGARRIRASREP